MGLRSPRYPFPCCLHVSYGEVVCRVFVPIPVETTHFGDILVAKFEG